MQADVGNPDDVEAMQLMVHREHDFFVGIAGRWEATAIDREKGRPITVRSDVVLTVREGKDNLRVFPDIFLVGARVLQELSMPGNSQGRVTYSSWPFQNGLEGYAKYEAS